MTRNSLHDIRFSQAGKVADPRSFHLDEYAKLFDPLRANPVRLLQIGVRNGCPLGVWGSYFERAVSITGCDIDPACAALPFDDPRIHVVIGDASDSTVARTICTPGKLLDIVIDDGSQKSGDMVRSFVLYFNELRPGGVYVVEDLYCGDREGSASGLHEATSAMAFFKRLVDVVSHEHWSNATGRETWLKECSLAHGISLDEGFLAQVHAVEFVNSMCIVRKDVTASVALGHQVASRTPGFVTPTAMPASDVRPEEHHQLRRMQARLAEAKAEGYRLSSRILDLETETRKLSKALSDATGAHASQINEFEQSTSWRVTAPMRRIKTAGLTTKAVAQRLRAAIRRPGGFGRVVSRAIDIYRQSGVDGLKRMTSQALGANQDYAEWVRRYDTLDADARASLRTRVDAMPNKLLISIVMPTYNPDPGWLEEAIGSVQSQIYPFWELCIADDASPDPRCRDILSRFAARDERIKVVFRESNGHISAASNSALEIATGQWVALMDHDDVLPEHALFWVVNEINANPDARLIYSDEDKLGADGERESPYFKPDWNIDLFYSQNMFSHLGVYETALLREVGGFRIGFEGAQDYDLVLRCMERVAPGQIRHIPKVLYHWRVHAQSTANTKDAKPYAQLAGERALNEHFVRVGTRGRVTYVGNGYQARYDLPDPAPLVSLIIPTRNAMQLVRQCVDSIEARTTYPNYEFILVDNGSDDPESLAYFETLKQRPNFRVIRDDSEFNYSKLNNLAVAAARGDIVGLINNDIEVITPDWLSEMVSIACQPGVGAVGARLWYPDHTLQHAGVVLGIGGVAGHAHKRLPNDRGGYFERAALIQSFSVVTAACLIVQKKHYLAVNGLNEAELKVAFNDVDFCLRLREAGLRNVWTPYAELFHHESATRGEDTNPEKQQRFAGEVRYMMKRWGDALTHDPAYNPNLTLVHEDFSLAWPPLAR
jgi:glycosyltransferase involved in cell wall biosynthesis